MNVRPITHNDIEPSLALMAEFHAASPMNGVAAFDIEKCRAFLAASLENSDILILLGELEGEIVGITSCLLYPLYFSQANVAQELWWWLTPKARGSGIGKMLFQAIESWSKQKGANALFMIALEDERAEAMEKVYFRAGFRPLERTFIKEF